LISCVAKGENLVQTCLDFAWFSLLCWLRNIAMVVSCYLIVVPGHRICCLVIVSYRGVAYLILIVVTHHISHPPAHLGLNLVARFLAYDGMICTCIWLFRLYMSINIEIWQLNLILSRTHLENTVIMYSVVVIEGRL
jgi:hypothetical protein